MAIPRTATMAKKPQVSLEALQEEIRKRAQLIFDDRVRRGIGGDDLSDWLKAEKEVKAKLGL
jgi:hypothetical protein